MTYLMDGACKSTKVAYTDEPSFETARILVANKLEINPIKITVVSVVPA